LTTFHRVGGTKVWNIGNEYSVPRQSLNVFNFIIIIFAIIGGIMKIVVTILLFMSLAMNANSETKKPLTIKENLQWGMLAEALSPYSSDFKNGEELLAELHSLQRVWEKKPVSEDELGDAMVACGYIEGIYQGFLAGVYAENQRQVYLEKKQIPKNPPIICKENVTIKELVDVVVVFLEETSKEVRKANNATNLVVNALLRSDLYSDNYQFDKSTTTK
jgi:hypothetical protein